jgi:ubiquinone/menaquinone biosynthesis C-methylase UbiE
MRGLEQIPWLYDGYMALADRTGLGRWRAWLARGARGRALDLGCGTGRNLGLLPGGVRAVGLDPHRENLAAARRRAPGVPLVVGSAEALPFKPGVFDTVLSSLVFCSVGDVPRGLAEVRRVLAPGGVLRMLEHVRSRHPVVARLQDAVQPAWTRATGGCHPNRDTEAAVEAAGLVIAPGSRRARGSLRSFEARAPERP